MIPVIGSLVMGSFAAALFWATISLGRPAASTPPPKR
jgi:hypothetical protein